jgi:hypothetical protein
VDNCPESRAAVTLGVGVVDHLVDRAGRGTSRRGDWMDGTVHTAPHEDSTAAIPARRRRFSRRPDARLLLGVALVLVSVVVGARLLDPAGEDAEVWSVRTPLAAGTTIEAADLEPVPVSLGAAASRYVSTTQPLAGATLGRDLDGGELVPAASVSPRRPGRLVSVPVDAAHAPSGLDRGQRIDLYATFDAGTAAARTEVVLEGVPVQEVQRGGGGLSTAASLGVVVLVAPDQVGSVVRAVQSADIDVSRVVATP